MSVAGCGVMMDWRSGKHVETAVRTVKEEKTAAVQEKAAANAEDRLVRIPALARKAQI